MPVVWSAVEYQSHACLADMERIASAFGSAENCTLSAFFDARAP
jgi:hypothetical protein